MLAKKNAGTTATSNLKTRQRIERQSATTNTKIKMLRSRRLRSLTTHSTSVWRPRTTGQRFHSTLQPSTLDTGFRLSPRPLDNPFTTDLAYRRVLSWYLPPDVLKLITPQLEKFGKEAISDEVNEWIANAETQQPYVQTRDVFNNRYPYDRLVTSQGWKELGKWGIRNG